MANNKSKSKAREASKQASRGLLLGRLFSLEFFKKNAIYIVALVVMALAYIANKFVCQSNMQEVITLKTDLENAQTDLVDASARYNSMIRETEMTKLMSQKNINLTAPQEPPYQIKSK